MNLSDMCCGGKCGICCFPFFKPIGYELNSEAKNFKEFFLKYHDKITTYQGHYHIKLNDDVKLSTKDVDKKTAKYSGFNSFKACGFLEILTEDDAVASMLCSIHENDSRPLVCQNHTPKNSDCSPIFHFNIKGLEINGRFFKLNPYLNDKLFNDSKNF